MTDGFSTAAEATLVPWLSVAAERNNAKVVDNVKISQFLANKKPETYSDL
jgi:hypothetical protein